VRGGNESTPKEGEDLYTILSGPHKKKKSGSTTPFRPEKWEMLDGPTRVDYGKKAECQNGKRGEKKKPKRKKKKGGEKTDTSVGDNKKFRKTGRPRESLKRGVSVNHVGNGGANGPPGPERKKKTIRVANTKTGKQKNKKDGGWGGPEFINPFHKKKGRKTGKPAITNGPTFENGHQKGPTPRKGKREEREKKINGAGPGGVEKTSNPQKVDAKKTSGGGKGKQNKSQVCTRRKVQETARSTGEGTRDESQGRVLTKKKKHRGTRGRKRETRTKST